MISFQQPFPENVPIVSNSHHALVRSDEDAKDAEDLNSFVLFSSVSSLIGLSGNLESLEAEAVFGNSSKAMDETKIRDIWWLIELPSGNN